MSNIPMTMRELQLSAVKCCTKCREPKLLTEFHRCKNGRDAKCKVCRAAATAGRRKTETIPRPTIASMQQQEAIGRALFSTFRTWQGGEPRSDWRADTGVACWPVEWQAVAA